MVSTTLAPPNLIYVKSEKCVCATSRPLSSVWSPTSSTGIATMAEWAFTTSRLLRGLKHQAMVKSCCSTLNTHQTYKCCTLTTWRTKMACLFPTNKTPFKDAVVQSPSTSCPIITSRFPVPPRAGVSEAALFHSSRLFHRHREHCSMFDLNSTPHSKITRYHTRVNSNRLIEFKVGKASSRSMWNACYKT